MADSEMRTVVFEQVDAARSFHVLATGEVDDEMLDVMEGYVARRRKRIAERVADEREHDIGNANEAHFET